MIEWLGGEDPASPIPTPIRAISSWTKFCASPPAAVIALQIARLTATMFLRLARSANRATGMPRVA
jgi:hypothetical protein